MSTIRFIVVRLPLGVSCIFGLLMIIRMIKDHADLSSIIGSTVFVVVINAALYSFIRYLEKKDDKQTLT